MDYRINGFAFNRDNLAGLDASERAGINRFLNARERAINTVSTAVRVCSGGPFDGQTIELETGHNSSAPFTVGQWQGRYVAGRNESDPATWEGAGAGPALENLQVHALRRGMGTAEKTLGKGFEQLGAMLASMSEAQDGPFAVFTIGRTSYRIVNTPAAVDALRAKILKAKRHFSDKLIRQAGPGVPARHTADIDAEALAHVAALERAQDAARESVAAVVATGAALANMTQVPAPEVVATVCATADAGQSGAAPSVGHAGVQDLGGPPAVCQGVQDLGARPGVQDQAPAARPGVQDLDDAPAEGPGVQDLAPATSGHPWPTAPGGMAADIPQSLARSAYQGTSYSPERRGDSARAEYAQTMAEDYATFYAHAVKGGTLDKLAAEFARYRAGMAGRYRAYLASSSRCVSSFIAGPSNFPARRMNKRADIAHKRLGEYLDGRALAIRAVVRNLRPDLRPIMAGDADAAERLALKIAQAERLQNGMKAINAAIRKHKKAGESHQVAALMEIGCSEARARELLQPDFCGRIGVADYELTNNNANIRRMRERLAQIEANQAAPVVERAGADGVRIEDDAPANRVRLFFPGKPAAEVRDQLKAAGFRWAPTVGAWQAYRNWRAMDVAQRLAGVRLAERPQAPEQAQDEPAADGQALAQDQDSARPEASTFAEYEGAVIDQVEQQLAEVSRSDAQGLTDAHPDAVAVSWARGDSAADAALAVIAASEVAPAAPVGVQDLAPAPAACSGVQDLAQSPPAVGVYTGVGVKSAGVQDLAPAPARPTKAAKPAAKIVRLFVPELGQRVAAKSGAWEAWLFKDARGRPALVFYKGNARKPTAHYWCKSEAWRRDGLARLARAADEVATQRDAKRAELAKPHGLTVGAVLVHSWGYDQTNIDYYQVTKLAGKRAVELREIAQERNATGDMTGTCVPCPGQFKGEAFRAMVTSGDQVRVKSFTRGYASPLEIVGTLPNGAPIYRRHSFSSYA